MMDKDWWRGAVIYQIYPRSFKDSNGDGVGDLLGLIEKLPYVASLGVDAIWISPFFKSPMKDFGYDVADYCDVDPIFGSLDDFRALIVRAHALGLKVLIDQVLSHCAEVHPWFIESRSSRCNPKSDWFVWADARADGTPPNNWLSVFGGSAWTWDTRRRQYYLHNFLSSQPDLNFHHPDVQAATLANIRFWLDLAVDGFRFDACNFHFHDRQLRNNPPARRHDATTVAATNPYGYQRHVHDKTQAENLAFLEQIRALLDEFGAVSVGEVGDDDSLAVMAAYTAGKSRLHMAYSFNLLTETFSAAHIRHEVGQLEKRIGDGWGCWSIGNHDVARVVSRWGGGDSNPQLPKMLLAMLLCLRGSACLYQGDELGLPEAEIPFALLQDPYGIAMWPEFKGRDGCRTPLPWSAARHGGFSSHQPWLPVPKKHRELAVASQDSDPESILNFFRQFICWRRSKTLLRRGAIQFFKTQEPILAFTRGEAGQCVLCVFNLSAKPIRWMLPKGLDPAPLSEHGLQGGKRVGRSVVLLPYGGWLATI